MSTRERAEGVIRDVLNRPATNEYPSDILDDLSSAGFSVVPTWEWEIATTPGDDRWRELAERDDERRWDIANALGWELEDESPSWREVMKGIADLRHPATSSAATVTPTQSGEDDPAEIAWSLVVAEARQLRLHIDNDTSGTDQWGTDLVDGETLTGAEFARELVRDVLDAQALADAPARPVDESAVVRAARTLIELHDDPMLCNTGGPRTAAAIDAIRRALAATPSGPEGEDVAQRIVDAFADARAIRSTGACLMVDFCDGSSADVYDVARAALAASPPAPDEGQGATEGGGLAYRDVEQATKALVRETWLWLADESVDEQVGTGRERLVRRFAERLGLRVAPAGPQAEGAGETAGGGA